MYEIILICLGEKKGENLLLLFFFVGGRGRVPIFESHNTIPA